MGSLCFSKKSENNDGTTPVPRSRVNNQDKAKLDIKKRQRELKEYQTKLDNQREQSIKIAKQQAKKGNKSRAMIQIRLKKMYDKNIQKAQNAHYMLDQTFLNIQSVQNDAAVLKVLKKGDQAIKEIKVDVGEFERIKENIDQYEGRQEELGDILKDDGFDEDQLLQDLKALGEDDDVSDYQNEKALSKIDLPNAAFGEVKPSDMSVQTEHPSLPKNQSAIESPEDQRKKRVLLQQ